tara:strand:- start:36 stop:467 length:432 start_codon:yes stop_codon:yes gene_type:complete
MVGKRLDLEHAEQVALVQWADYQWVGGDAHLGDYLFAVPNGARMAMNTAKKMKAEGLRSGVPDLMLAIPVDGYYGLFIEMKKGREHFKGQAAVKNAVSENQKAWMSRLRSQGYFCVVCYGFDEAKTAIQEYILRGRTDHTPNR